MRSRITRAVDEGGRGREERPREARRDEGLKAEGGAAKGRASELLALNAQRGSEDK